MEISKKIKDLGLLAELAYLKLEHEFFSDKDYSYIKIDDFFKSKINTDNEYIGTGVDNSITSMLAILNKYDIKHFKSFSSGLQLMILEDKTNSGKYTLSFRGTEFGIFTIEDLVSDFDMALGNEIINIKRCTNCNI